MCMGVVHVSIFSWLGLQINGFRLLKHNICINNAKQLSLRN